MAKSSFFTGDIPPLAAPPPATEAQTGDGNDAAPSSFFKGSTPYENITAPSELADAAAASAAAAAASAVAAAASAEVITTLPIAWGNTRLAKTAAYTVLNADLGKTIALGGSAFYVLTFDAASGYDADFAVFVINEDTGRAKNVAISGGTTFKLYPGQTAIVYNQNNIWRVYREQRWKLTTSLDFYVDPTSGSDTTGDGLATGTGAYATFAAAATAVAQHLDFAGQTVDINLADGTYTTSLQISQGWIGGGNLRILGNTATSTVTITNASPGVVTWNAHGLVANKIVQFTTTGALPTGLTAGVLYYVKNVLSANTFTVSATLGGAEINTSSAGSGTHTANAAANVYVNVPGAPSVQTITTPFSGTLSLQSMMIGGQTGIGHGVRGLLNWHDIIFNTCTAWGVSSQGGGAKARAGSSFSIIGNYMAFFLAVELGEIQCNSVTATLANTPAFSVAFAFATRSALIDCEFMTWVGSATGSRYLIDTGSVIYSGGTSGSFPGNAAGTGGTTTGGGFLN